MMKQRQNLNWAGGICVALLGGFVVSLGASEAHAQSTRALYGMEHRWQAYGRDAAPAQRYRASEYDRYPVQRVAAYAPVPQPRYAARPYYGDGYGRDAYRDAGYRAIGYRDVGYRDAGYGDRGYGDRGYGAYDAGYRQVPLRPIGGAACPGPAAYAPYAAAAPTRPVNVNVQAAPSGQRLGRGRYIGRGILGQSTLYKKGEPVRNILRAFTP